MDNLEERIAKERHRRQVLARQRRPYRHHLAVNGGAEPSVAPDREVWCEYCQGFFGVTHDNLHTNQNGGYQSCRNVGRALNGDRQCACIECMCAESMGLHRRVTES